jgi:hypothetical protein
MIRAGIGLGCAGAAWARLGISPGEDNGHQRPAIGGSMAVRYTG